MDSRKLQIWFRCWKRFRFSIVLRSPWGRSLGRQLLSGKLGWEKCSRGAAPAFHLSTGSGKFSYICPVMRTFPQKLLRTFMTASLGLSSLMTSQQLDPSYLSLLHFFLAVLSASSRWLLSRMENLSFVVRSIVKSCWDIVLRLDLSIWVARGVSSSCFWLRAWHFSYFCLY